MIAPAVMLGAMLGLALCAWPDRRAAPAIWLDMPQPRESQPVEIDADEVVV
jgi:hypothetical protein